MLQGECINCGRNSWLIDYLCPKCIRKKEEKELLTQGNMSKGGLNDKPKGERPTAPPKNGSSSIRDPFLLKEIEKLQEENILLREENKNLKFIREYETNRSLELFKEIKELKEENDLLSEHCAKLEQPIIVKVLKKSRKGEPLEPDFDDIISK